MELTKKQETTFKRAIKLLTPYNKEDVSYRKYMFEVEGDWLDSDYDCCDNPKCIEEVKKLIRKDQPELKAEIDEIWTDNNGDHEHIESCCICFRPLNEFLTWVRQEFEHHGKYSVNRRDLKNSRNAFEIIAIFQSMPSVDERPSPWAMINEPKEALQREKDFAKEIVTYAELVINKLSNGTKSSKGNRRKSSRNTQAVL